MTGIDCKTYNGSAGAGGRITLARLASALALSAHGTAVFWVRPNVSGGALGAVPAATPAPAAQATADGWLRVAGAESPPNGGANNVPLPPGQEIRSLDVWCEADGYTPSSSLRGASSPREETRVKDRDRSQARRSARRASAGVVRPNLSPPLAVVPARLSADLVEEAQRILPLQDDVRAVARAEPPFESAAYPLAFVTAREDIHERVLHPRGDRITLFERNEVADE